MVPSHERGFQERSRALALSACFSSPFISTRRADSGTVAVCFSEAGGRARVFGVVFVCLCLVRKMTPIQIRTRKGQHRRARSRLYRSYLVRTELDT
jgi:hypothetical protein